MGKSYRDTRGKFSDHRKPKKVKKKLNIKNKILKRKDDEFYDTYENNVLNFNCS